jgi:hypothetical protein
MRKPGKAHYPAQKSTGCQEELEHHLRSSEYHNVLLVLEMALQEPEIRFITNSHSRGVEAIEDARRKAS